MTARSLEEQIDIDRVRSLYGTAPLACAIGAFAGGLWVLVFAATEGVAVMLVFFALVLANQATRLVLWHRQRAEPDDAARARVWARRYTWTMLSGGLIWGFGSVFFFPAHDPARQMFILVAAYGISSGATAPNAYHPPAMFAFLVATLLPVLVRVFAEGGVVHGVIGVSLLIQIVVMILFGLGMSRQLRESIRMRHENTRLVGELRDKTAVAEAAQRKAEQASLAKSQFFAAASHDLRQPMQALGLFAASLRETKRDPADARRIDQILSSVDTLESLFDELLDISKLDAGYVKPAPSHFPARVLFERLETAYAPLARRSNLVLSLDHADAVLHTDAVLLERVLGNLIANALRYTPAGSVRVSCRDAGERVAIAVADTGVGIPREEHEKVFDEFYQLGNPERDRRKGLGLGLATVKRMTQLLGCRVTLDSAPGRGSVFAVEVPKGDAAQVAPTSGEVSAEDVNALHGKVIAVIDDERDVRDGLAELLGQWRCKPLVAASTAELLHQLGAERPDAVIADYRLREHQTGVGVARALRERYGAALPVLIMSGDTTQEIFTAVREHRLPLLSKPVRAARLRAALLHLLSREPAAVPDA
jgi:signal transduction histidine kinase/ActR/RegA family two-component response regulator